MAAAGRRGVGDVPAAEALEQFAERGRLVVDLRRIGAMFMILLSGTTMNVAPARPGSRSSASMRPVAVPGS